MSNPHHVRNAIRQLSPDQLYFIRKEFEIDWVGIFPEVVALWHIHQKFETVLDFFWQ